VVTPARPVASQSEAIRLEDDMPMAEARAAWTLVTRKKKRVQFQTYQSPKELAAKALAAAALALKVQGASASSVDVNASSSSNGLDVVWVQLVAAAALWATYTMVKHFVRRSRRATRALNITTFLAAAALTNQSIGGWPPILQLWERLVLVGAAAPAIVLIASVVAIFAIIWQRTERNLARKAVNL